MIQKTTLQFLKDLKKNNNKEWFEAHRKEFEAAKQNFLDFITELLQKIAVFDPEIAEVKAKDCIFRINRDVRFSKDKSPYKAYFGAAISMKGRKSTYPGYYVHMEPGEVIAGGGAYMLMPDELQKIRQEIDYNSKEFLKIVNNKTFKAIYTEVKGESLVNPPKGFDAESEAIDFIKQKQWYVMTSKYKDSEVTSDQFEKSVLQALKALRPFNLFLQKAMND